MTSHYNRSYLGQWIPLLVTDTWRFEGQWAKAQHGPDDWDLYYDVKDPACDIIMAGAEDWAASTGWRVEHYS